MKSNTSNQQTPVMPSAAGVQVMESVVEFLLGEDSPARQALERSPHARVRAFAETMVRDHAAVNQQALALVQRLHVTPEANATSAALTTQAAEAHRRLGALSGAAFDQAYVENEVAYHRAVNEALRGTLIPGAHNAELKSLLEAGLTLFSAHQEHAEQLGQQLRAPARR